MLSVTERKKRYARMAGAIFGTHATWYKPTREGWYLYWRHARMRRAVRYTVNNSRLIPEPWMQYEGPAHRRFCYVGIPGRNGVDQAEREYTDWYFRYRLICDTVVAMKGGSYAEAQPLINKARQVLLKETKV